MNNSKVNILFVLPQLGIGGGELQTLKLIQNLNKNKYRIYLCNLDSNRNDLLKDFVKAGAQIIPVTRNKLFDYNMLITMRKFIIEHQVHILHSVLNNFWSRLAVLGLFKLVIIASERSVDNWWKKWYHFLADNILGLYTDKILCNAFAIKDFYIKKLPLVPIKKFQVIYNAIDKEKFQITLTDQEKAELFEKYNISSNKIIFIIVAGLRPIKNHITLLKAVEILKNDESLNFELLIIGEGQEEKTLKSYVKETKLGGYVKFLGGINDVGKLLNLADVGIISSEQEGLSNAIIEYMTAGLPVIASDVGGNPELVDHNINGYIYKNNDYETLANYMRLLIEDPSLIQQYGQASMLKVVNNFEIDSMVRAYENLYTSCLEKTKPLN